MIVDRTELNKELSIDKYFDPFFSVLIPELGRPDYVTNCVDSILDKADMPVEIVLHDDGSGQEKQKILYENLKDKVSTLVFNMGYNTGLARSMNRCKLMSTSKYLIGFNSDEYVTSSFLRAMKDALDLPYVGIVNVAKEIGEGPGTSISKNGYKIRLFNGTGTCHCYGIRRDVWDEIGGWDENVQTTASDVGFVGTVFGHGYFTVQVEGTVTNEMWLKSKNGKTNISGFNKDYVETGQFCRNDNNVPKIFGISNGEHSRRCERRREAIWHGVNDAQNADRFYPQWYNGNFQTDQVSKLFRNGKIDWEFAKKYGHDKYKGLIKEHFGL